MSCIVYLMPRQWAALFISWAAHGRVGQLVYIYIQIDTYTDLHTYTLFYLYSDIKMCGFEISYYVRRQSSE